MAHPAVGTQARRLLSAAVADGHCVLSPSHSELDNHCADDPHWSLHLRKESGRYRLHADTSQGCHEFNKQPAVDGCVTDMALDDRYHVAGRLFAPFAVPNSPMQNKQLADCIATKGRDTLGRLRGEFTLWFTNHRQRSWTVYRSPLRGAPIYYYQSADSLMVGTDLLAICRQLPNVHLNRQWLSHFFAGEYAAAGTTPFNDLHCLPAGSALLIDGLVVAEHVVYHPTEASDDLLHTEADWAAAWSDALDIAVHQTVDGYQNVGIMLSSGLDSGGLAAALSRHPRTGPEMAQAFSWRFNQQAQADESTAVQRVADSLGLPLQFIEVDDALCFAQPESWPVALQAPYFNAMRRMKNRLYQTASEQGCQALLNGHYGDYLYYSDHYELSELWNHRQWRRLAGQLRHIVQEQRWHWHQEPALRHWLKSWLLPNGRKALPPHWLTNRAQQTLNPAAAMPTALAHRHQRPIQYHQLTSSGMLDALHTELELTQPYGLRRYHPYLNERLIVLALAAPTWLLNQPGQTKYIMRQALAGQLPDGVRNSPRVGQLDSLFVQGLQHHHQAISEYLFRQQRRWPEYVAPSVVETVLQQRQWQHAASVLVPCLGFERWLDRWRELGFDIR